MGYQMIPVSEGVRTEEGSNRVLVSSSGSPRISPNLDTLHDENDGVY